MNGKHTIPGSATDLIPNSPTGDTLANSTSQSNADIRALRLPPSYGETQGVKKLLTKVTVGKPKQGHFYRTHPSDAMVFNAILYADKTAQENYLVSPEIGQVLSALVQPCSFYVAIDRQNNLYLIPVRLPGESGTRNSWPESLLAAIDHAKSHWIRTTANMSAGAYDIYEATGRLPDPEWPTHSIEFLIEVAFRNKIINSLDHPIVQKLLGEI